MKSVNPNKSQHADMLKSLGYRDTQFIENVVAAMGSPIINCAVPAAPRYFKKFSVAEFMNRVD